MLVSVFQQVLVLQNDGRLEDEVLYCISRLAFIKILVVTRSCAKFVDQC